MGSEWECRQRLEAPWLASLVLGSALLLQRRLRLRKQHGSTRRSVCDWHYHFFCISVSRKFRFFESFFRKIGKTSGNCNVIRHFLENLWKSDKFSWKSAKIAMKSHFKMQNFTNFFGNACKICKKFDENLLKFCEWSGAKVWKSCRSRKSWKNEYLVAIVAVHTAENETLKVWITDLSDHTLDHIPNLL